MFFRRYSDLCCEEICLLSRWKNNPFFKNVWPIFGALLLSMLVTVVVYFSNQLPENKRSTGALLSDLTGSMTNLFTSEFPASRRFQSELEQIRQQGKLKSEDEVLINRWILVSTQHLKMPPAILWCLLFQESRLNHLEGIDGSKASSGIGQFSHYSFYEVNHHLDQFTKDNYDLVIKMMGKDIRPIEPKKKDIHHASSYYFIPTAVTSSAIYLNNRYHQLRAILERNKISYDPELLWFYATMAYNKGTRSVLSFWNDAQSRGGKPQVERLVSENNSFLKSLNDPVLFNRTLKRIWTGEEVDSYARELKVHMANMKDCVLANQKGKN